MSFSTYVHNEQVTLKGLAFEKRTGSQWLTTTNICLSQSDSNYNDSLSIENLVQLIAMGDISGKKHHNCNS